jgi:Ca-activated chloride channel family protein
VRERAIVIAVAVAAVIVAVVLSTGGKGGKGHGSPHASGDAIHVSFAYSPEKEALLKPVIARFNSARVRSGGRPVFVDASVVASGDAETKIAHRRLRPVAWSPASSLWGRLLTQEADQPWVAPDNPSIVRTPLVIAMWEPLARALGWPAKPVGFAQVLALATSPRGWADFGKPEFGAFKLGHTNPDFSTSGLSAVAAEYYAAIGKHEGLTEADVTRADVRKRIQTIENSIVHYGDTTLFFADQLKAHGPAYASAVAMEEVTLVDFNRGRTGTKLVGIYPAEGTFFSDNPLIVLRAPWVTPAQRAAAEAFSAWLRAHVTAQTAAAAGFRPGDQTKVAGAPIDAAHGADPNQPTRVLSLPEPPVLARIKRTWREDRKPANVELVVDTSGSMSEEGKLDQAKDGLRAFFRQLSPRDQVGLLSFDSDVTERVPIAPFSENRARLTSAVGDLLPDGETAVYDATSQAVDLVEKRADHSRINAVVVLTDGEDTKSRLEPGALVAALKRRTDNSEGLPIRVYTIAYGSQANQKVLGQIADASSGKAFVGDPTQIESVYRSISSFF